MRTNTAQRTLVFRNRAAIALFLAFAMWPPVHMLLSCSGEFSSWRFGGWGMYATPDPALYSWVHVIPSDGAHALGRHTHLSVGERDHPFESLPSSATPSPAALAASRRLRVFYDVEAARMLIAAATTSATTPELARGVALVIRPRIDLWSLRSHDEIEAFRVNGDGIQRRRFHTDEPNWRAQFESFVEAGEPSIRPRG